MNMMGCEIVLVVFSNKAEICVILNEGAKFRIRN